MNNNKASHFAKTMEFWSFYLNELSPKFTIFCDSDFLFCASNTPFFGPTIQSLLSSWKIKDSKSFMLSLLMQFPQSSHYLSQMNSLPWHIKLCDRISEFPTSAFCYGRQQHASNKAFQRLQTHSCAHQPKPEEYQNISVQDENWNIANSSSPKWKCWEGQFYSHL